MDPGKLDKRIMIQKYDIAKTVNGFKEQKWIDYKPLWASMQNLYGREYFAAAAVNAEKTVKFNIRYFKDLDSAVNTEGKKTTEVFRIKYKNSIFDIKFIDNIKNENIEMEIKALENQNG